MAEHEEPSSEPTAAPGMRWVEQYDPRLTNRITLVQVPLDAPDPVVPDESPELVARTRRLMQDLMDRNATNHATRAVRPDPDTTETP